ncbi:nitroreductase family deazaflavin-dependent oxidoreductase [Nocardia sp. CA-135953]|uniref:nitroreductase family deazaflavin-dependent oxidoreductase n=1 Tax=Nocardia sp. CA-135953 TaxID=3239978 RepID=UPI003D987ED7
MHLRVVERTSGFQRAGLNDSALQRTDDESGGGIRSSMIAELETIGAKSGQPRLVPVTVSIDDDGAWLISQHGHRAGWARNIAANPQVRLRQGSRWYAGTAAFVPDDDVVARARSFAKGSAAESATAWTIKALESDPISVRITFTAA